MKASLLSLSVLLVSTTALAIEETRPIGQPLSALEAREIPSAVAASPERLSAAQQAIADQLARDNQNIAAARALATSRVQAEAVTKLPPHLFEEKCEIMVSIDKGDPNREAIHTALGLKGYIIKDLKEEAAAFKKGLRYALSGSKGKEARKHKHLEKNCQALNGKLSLNFETGWKTEPTAYVSTIIKKYDIADCSKINTASELVPSKVLATSDQEFQSLVGIYDSTAESFKVSQTMALTNSMERLPVCIPVTVSTDPNDAAPTGAPLPEQDLSVDSERANSDKAHGDYQNLQGTPELQRRIDEARTRAQRK